MKIYHIPTNFKDTGYVFKGMIATRNFIDGLILGLIGFLIASALPIKQGSRLSGYIFIVGFMVMLGISGIQGIPVSSYLFDFIQWIRRKKPYLYNNHGASFNVTAAQVMMSEPQLRNTIADTIDRIKENMASRHMEYIEGETFQFAEDPELEALRFASEQDDDKTQDKTTGTTVPVKEPEPVSKPVATVQMEEEGDELEDIDFSQLIDDLMLQETGDNT